MAKPTKNKQNKKHLKVLEQQKKKELEQELEVRESKEIRFSIKSTEEKTFDGMSKVGFDMDSGSFEEVLANTIMLALISHEVLTYHELDIVFNNIQGLPDVLKYLIICNFENKEVELDPVHLDISYRFKVNKDNKTVDDKENFIKLELGSEYYQGIIMYLLYALSLVSVDYLKNLNIPIGDAEINEFITLILSNDIQQFEHPYRNIYRQFHEFYHEREDYWLEQSEQDTQEAHEDFKSNESLEALENTEDGSKETKGDEEE